MHQHPQRTIDRARRMLDERVWPAVEHSATPLQITARRLAGEPEPFDQATAGPFEPFTPGSRWGEPWTTTWFRLQGAVPVGRAGAEPVVAVDLGFEGGPGFQSEGLAYRADGSILKGVQPRNHYVPIDDQLTMIDIYVEAAANPDLAAVAFRPTRLGDGIDVDGEPHYRFRRADLVLLDRDVEALAVDLDVLIGWAEQLRPDEPRRAKIIRSLGQACDLIDPQRIADSVPAARAELAPLLEQPATASAHRLAAVGHAHIDSAWLWPVRETVRKCTRTFSNVLSLIEDYPELRFACSQAQQYAWIEEQQPKLFARIAEAVAAGQFVPAGGMWVESDTNMPGGEALVRQFLYGKSYFADRFGVEPQEVWLPDSFGYSAALPQIAALAGYRWFLTQKLAWHPTNKFPHHTFWWEGIDGSRVFAHLPPVDSYLAELTPAELQHASTNFSDHAGAGTSLVPFGHGDGGGGPTRLMMERARRQADLEGAPPVEHLTPTEFFERAQADYSDAPTWVGELYMEAHRGTYTSQAAMKRGNRRAEHLLREAELWSASATLRTGADYPYDALDRCWKTVLLHQFHDILPGSSIAWVHREARAAYDSVLADLEQLIMTALTTLAGSGDTIVRFNAAPVPADGVPALGAAEGLAAGSEAPIVQRDDDRLIIDNRTLRMIIEPDGTISSLIDLRSARELVAEDARLADLVIHQDLPNAFDAWDLDAFYRGSATPIRSLDSLQVSESDGAVTVEVKRSFGSSSALQTITISPGSDRVDFAVDVDWQEREKLLKVVFGLDLRADESSAEIQFGHLRRPTHDNTTWDEAKFEICAQRWVHVGEPRFGVAVANDSTYGHSVRRIEQQAAGRPGTEIGLSLLRAPRYPDPDTDQGSHRARYSLITGAGIGDAVAAGLRLNLPVRRITGGAAPEPIVTVDGEGIVIEAIKLAEDRSGDLIVRLYESLGARTRGRLRWDIDGDRAEIVDLLERGSGTCDVVDHGVDVELRPFQILTVRISAPGVTR
ncbi:alpha-mannosidase [Microlunatus soli]|uniref:Alpha-mannosidase n=1 Tax=Microlunatus soli TaxID=630515 RepID=A0A1H1ZMR2_9ACTN|nr:glycoside hydrolase family 38 C-terminal domain-containing protein [Microlunatus soli]SDT35095.1 alpha-mannosidase [Microlunatus soli]